MKCLLILTDIRYPNVIYAKVTFVIPLMCLADNLDTNGKIFQAI